MPLQGTPVVQYYIDEAASGTTPTSVLDSSGNNYHLTTVNYGSGNLAYTEVSGQRGLVSSSTTGTQRASRAIDNTSDALRNAIHGATGLTLEVVVNLTAFSASGGRIFGVTNRAGGNGALMLRGTSTTNWEITYSGNVGSWFAGEVADSWDGGSGARAVFHVVIDSTQADAADRVKVYKDGSLITSTTTNSVSLNEGFLLPADHDLIMFNRESSGSFDRSIQGTLFYAAIYASALSSTQVSNNATVLAADDDTPAAGGGQAVRTMHHFHQQGIS